MFPFPPESTIVRNALAAIAAFLLAAAARAVDTTTVFNEVMYHPPGAAETEWIELRNEMAVNMDLTGWRITGGVNFTFPANTTIPAGGHVVVAANLGALPGVGALGPWTGALDNGSETIELKNAIGRVMDEFHYEDSGQFPAAADGGGVSLAKRASGLASSEAGSWTWSGQVGGTPGAENFPGGLVLGPPVTLSAFDANWNYNQAGANLGAAWAATTYAPGGNWLSGAGVFAFENDPVALPVGTVLAVPGATVTHYFQRTFNFLGNPAQHVLQLTSLLDDGAVVSLNGVEAARINVGAGVVDGTTRAASVIDNAVVSAPLTIPTASLVSGANVVSVSVHAEPAGGGTNGGLVLVEPGGSIAAQDLALAANGGTAIAKDLLGNGAYAPTHTIPNLNNGTYGNGSSWIGNSANSWAGIGLGATTLDLSSYVLAASNAPAGIALSGTLAPGALLVLDQTQLGFRPLLDDRVFIYNAARTSLLDAAVVRSTTRARSGADFFTPTAADFRRGEHVQFSKRHRHQRGDVSLPAEQRPARDGESRGVDRDSQQGRVASRAERLGTRRQHWLHLPRRRGARSRRISRSREKCDRARGEMARAKHAHRRQFFGLTFQQRRAHRPPRCGRQSRG